MNAIITHADGHVALAVLRSLGRRNIQNTAVSSNKKALAFYSKYCKNKLISNYDLDFFLKLSENEIIMPMDEDIMMLLAKNKTKCKCKLPFSDYHTLEKVINKSLLMKHAVENKIPCPRTYFLNNSDDIYKIEKEIDFPVVIKPNRGTGGKGIIYVNRIQDLKKNYDCVVNNYGPSIIQEKIPYKDRYTVAALFNTDFKVRRVCVLKANRIYPLGTGPACFVETVIRADILELSLKILESLNYFGIAELEFVIDERDKKPKLMEINPRFWGSLQGAISAGVDFPYLLYKMVVEGDIDVSLTYNTGIKCRNIIFGDLFHLLTILKGKYTINYKLSKLIDFIKFYQDDSYYLFTLEDIKPFIAFLPIKLYKKFY